jgi:uncharacterized protein (DUF2147 family)
VFDVARGHGQSYVHFSKIFNQEGTGYMQKLAPVEDTIFRMTNPLINKWRNAGKPDVVEIKTLGKSICSLVENAWPQIE